MFEKKRLRKVDSRLAEHDLTRSDLATWTGLRESKLDRWLNMLDDRRVDPRFRRDLVRYGLLDAADIEPQPKPFRPHGWVLTETDKPGGISDKMRAIYADMRRMTLRTDAPASSYVKTVLSRLRSSYGPYGRPIGFIVHEMEEAKIFYSLLGEPISGPEETRTGTVPTFPF